MSTARYILSRLSFLNESFKDLYKKAEGLLHDLDALGIDLKVMTKFKSSSYSNILNSSLIQDGDYVLEVEHRDDALRDNRYKKKMLDYINKDNIKSMYDLVDQNHLGDYSYFVFREK